MFNLGKRENILLEGIGIEPKGGCNCGAMCSHQCSCSCTGGFFSSMTATEKLGITKYPTEDWRSPGPLVDG